MYRSAGPNSPRRGAGGSDLRIESSREIAAFSAILGAFVGGSVLLCTHSLVLSPIFAGGAFVVALLVFTLLRVLVTPKRDR